MPFVPPMVSMQGLSVQHPRMAIPLPIPTMAPPMAPFVTQPQLVPEESMHLLLTRDRGVLLWLQQQSGCAIEIDDPVEGMH